MTLHGKEAPHAGARGVVEADDADDTTVTMPFTPPAAAGAVDFIFVVRDLRGGSDATTRSACVR